MSHMLEARMVLNAHHGGIGLRRASIISLRSTVVIVVIVVAALVCKILWPLVLMCAAIVLEAAYDFIDVRRRVLV